MHLKTMQAWKISSGSMKNILERTALSAHFDERCLSRVVFNVG